MTTNPEINPNLDLVLERVVDVPPAAVWEAWTNPEQLKTWFTPRPWTVSEVEIDLRPGGIFRTVMRSPEGENIPAGSGCILEVVPHERLTWTGAMQAGYRPAPASSEMPFTAIITMTPEGAGTRYVATVLHRNEEEKARHETMGFHHGWGAALDQLVGLIKGTFEG